MKKLLLVLFAISFGLIGYSQNRAVLPKPIRDVNVQKTKAIKGGGTQSEVLIPGVKSADLMEENKIGGTFYDVQSNRSVQNRIYLFGDGTVGGVWTRGPENSPSGPNRGTGYNYFDGNEWGPYPTQAIESGAQAGWPSYTTYGENGEAYTCHDYYDGTILGTRTEKGTGDWNLIVQGGPPGAVDISFPRVMTTGLNRDIIHVLSTTWVAYNGQTTALLYARTSDAGATWDVENMLFEELGPTYYSEIGGDTYEFADTKNNTLAFLAGDNWTDLVLMKSTDNGDTWNKTVIWECPYPLWTSGTVTDTFYCPDGSHHLAWDNNGLIHVVFSVTRGLSADGTSQSYFPGVDGVVYWNENRPTFSSDVNALNPYGEAGTELVEDYSLIGWSQDIDGDGSLNILPDIAAYNTGLSSHPQITIDDQNRMFVIYSSVTENYDNGTSNFRHIWARTSPDGGTSWGTFYDMHADLIYFYDECVWPSISPTSDDNIYFVYQADNTPGYTTTTTVENNIRVMSVLKTDILNGVNENKAIISDSRVSQNYPNPFNNSSTVYVMLEKSASLSLEVTNLVGQVVYSAPAKQYPAGRAEITIQGSGLKSGIYFYTIRSGEASVTKKMMIE
jgi:hypothetical protein